MKHLTFILTFALALIVLPGCRRHDARPDFGMNEDIDAIFTRMFSDDEPGAAVMVMYKDTLIYSGFFGFANLETNERMSDSTMLNITAASKTFISAAILKLQEEGRLKLTDSLSKYFPQFTNPVFRGITIEHVLTHTTGLPDERPRSQDQWEKYRDTHSSAFGFGPDFRKYARGDELIRFFETVDTITFVPGSHFDYQDAPYLLLPPIIEKVTGKRFEAWMKANIFDKAGLKEVVYFSPEIDIPHLAHAYEPPQHDTSPEKVYNTKKSQWIEADYGEVDYFASQTDMGVYISPRDFMKWLQISFDCRLLSRESMENILRPRVATSLPDVSYCLGAFITDNPYEPRKVFHSRRNGGFSTYTSMYPELGLYYFVIANRGFWDRYKVAEQIDSIIFSNPRFPELNGLLRNRSLLPQG